jgi:peptidoglycan hydrolase CwlO-like protein
MKDGNLQKTAHKVTRWVGSPHSIIAHTVVFAACFVAVWFNVLPFDRMLLILTTVVSLEAIYLAIFIQMSVNAQAQSIAEVEHDIDEIQGDIDEIQEDVEDIQVNEEEDEARDIKEEKTLEELRQGLQTLMESVERMQQK